MATRPETRREERFAREGDRPAPRRRARDHVMKETRPAFKTTEFYAYCAVTIGVLVAGLFADGAGGLSAWNTWLIVGIVTGAYMISRGLAKAGNAERWAPGRDDGVE